VHIGAGIGVGVEKDPFLLAGTLINADSDTGYLPSFERSPPHRSSLDHSLVLAYWLALGVKFLKLDLIFFEQVAAEFAERPPLNS
jgi:hypothetical protein